jgi:cell division transport system permease protein
MNVWLSQRVRTLAATIAKLVRSPVATLLNIGVIGVALALPAGFYVALTSLQGYARELAADPQLSLFLALDAGGSDVAQIETRLKRHPAVRKFSYVSREQALREMKASTGLADVVDSLAHNPLPDAFVIDAGERAPQTLEALRDEIKGWPKVEHVQLDSAWARRLESLLKLGRLAVLLLGTLLAFALIAITFNTIRLQIMTQREEIEVVKLIGATDPFIRRPFLYYGAMLGLTGGLAAWMIVAAGVYLLNDALTDLSRLYGNSIQLHPLAPEDSLSLLLFSGGLGWFGAWLSVNQYLSKIDRR